MKYIYGLKLFLRRTIKGAIILSAITVVTILITWGVYDAVTFHRSALVSFFVVVGVVTLSYAIGEVAEYVQPTYIGSIRDERRR